MPSHRIPVLDSTPSLLATGFSWLPSRWRRNGNNAVQARLLGKRTIAFRGPDAIPFVYDEHHVRRSGAIPKPVQKTLFGQGGVQTLDGEAHRVRKALFLELLNDPARVESLGRLAGRAWDDAAGRWMSESSVVLFDEAAEVLTRAVCEWAGVPLDESDAPQRARQLIATVDGFATLTQRHWQARLARNRLERWLTDLVVATRDGTALRDGDNLSHESVVDALALHRDANGRLLEPRIAAIELLNILRPTVAVAWYITFAAHAMHRWPEERVQLRSGDEGYADAFANEVRRFYPFAPFIGGRAARRQVWRGQPIPEGAMVLLDLYGQNHDSDLWPDPYAFTPDRFLHRAVDPDRLVPQGGGDPAVGHRCPGELVTIELIKVLSRKLVALDYDVPEQDLRIPLTRIPTRPRSGFVITNVQPTARRADAT